MRYFWHAAANLRDDCSRYSTDQLRVHMSKSTSGEIVAAAFGVVLGLLIAGCSSPTPVVPGQAALHVAPRAGQTCDFFSQTLADTLETGLVITSKPGEDCVYKQDADSKQFASFSMVSGDSFRGDLSKFQSDLAQVEKQSGIDAQYAPEPSLGPGAFSESTAGEPSSAYIGGASYSFVWTEGKTNFELTSYFGTEDAVRAVAQQIYANS